MATAASGNSPQPPRRAFISHATADDSYVAELESFLRAMGFDDVFNDSSAIHSDEKFWPAIEQGIANSEALVVVITAASNASDWVRREVEWARSLPRRVIPLWIEDCDVPAVFADRDVIDFRPRRRAERRTDLSRILRYAPEQLVGREAELQRISDAWARTLRAEAGRPQILTFVALGGEGKTSLVAKWAVDELLAKGWPGCEAAFAWSFYSQGTRDQVAASSDVFLKAALDFFGDDDDRAFAASSASAYEKGQRLARVVGRQRSLLILDGLEPLQYAPTSPTPGELKDQGLTALLRGLAQNSHGLCLVTTRYPIADLKAFRQSTVREETLLRLSREAGIHLLRQLGVKGHAPELAALVKDFKGHALTLTLLGRYLHRAFGGDIRKRDRLKLQKADTKVANGHAFRAMAAYERWLSDSGEDGRREVAILRLLGLFDRPADAACIAALRREPIGGLTDPLDELNEEDWACCLDDLERMGLISVQRKSGSGELLALDAHPLLREYFARRLREDLPDAWRAAHRRLYEHLRDRTREGDQPTLEDLQPLYQAVVHGCKAGLQEQACDEVYFARIGRHNETYSAKKLGAFHLDLGALANFFERPWNQVSHGMTDDVQAWLLNEAAFRLRALGRLTEAIEPMQAGLCRDVLQSRWVDAARGAGNLSELRLTLGEVAAAVQDARQAVAHADRSDNPFQCTSKRATLADALHQAGRPTEALALFREAEQMQQEQQLDYALLYSLSGFRYAELLLAPLECSAWKARPLGLDRSANASSTFRETLRAVANRFVRTIGWGATQNLPMHIALDHLTLSRFALYSALLIQPALGTADLAQAGLAGTAAVAELRRAGTQDYLPLSLLTRSWLRAITGPLTGPDSAQADLDEAWEVAERGPMRLHMADIHLYRARLFFRQAEYPWESPEADLHTAGELIERCGYGRRREELADAEAALAQWRQRGSAPT